MAYDIDLRDIHFQLFDWLQLEETLEHQRFADWDRENIELVLAEALKIAGEELDPANEPGDREGSRLEDGRVFVPEVYRQPFATIAEGGWISTINNPEYGGLGLPHQVATAINEMFSGSNMALSLVFLLTRGAGELIEHHGTDEMRRLFCQKLYAGTWTGTMCLTEPQAGSDVGASTSRAEPIGDGRYKVTGEKIFITFGDHDMTDNVVHTVLARVPGAPAGTRGLSLFVVPKVRVEEDGSLGEANDVVCGGIEHKLGIHGAPTCSLLFGPNGACEGYLLGEENSGMKLMFEMMNSARLEVGLQGLAVGAAAYEAAKAYARERVQSRHWSQMRDRKATPVAIIEHPDVRRLLLGAKAYAEAIRALMLKTASFIDRAQMETGDEAAASQAMVELLTPVCKAWGSDWGFRITEWCLQVYGGYGYIKDYPAEQYLRDAKIASIYEGTNGIQALDLVARKLPAQDGAAFRALVADVQRIAEGLADTPALAGPGEQLAEALSTLVRVTSELRKRSDATAILMLDAVPLLDMVGHTVAGAWLLEQAQIAEQKLQVLLEEKGVAAEDEEAYRKLLETDGDAAHLHDKVQTATYFAFRALPNVQAFAAAIEAADASPIEARF